MISRPLLRTLSTARTEGRLAVFCFVLLITMTCLASDAGAQNTATMQQADDTAARNAGHAKSTVRGRVVYDDSGRPLRRVSVMLFDPSSTGNRQQRMAWTDANGEFILKNVIAGKYYLVVDAPGIIRQEPFNSGEDLSDIATVSVNGIDSAEVKVRVRRGGVISGKVTYADGEPAISATLNILRKKGRQMIPFYLSQDCGNGIQTDERGFYRVSGLPPGEYFVGAAERKMREISQGNDGGTSISSALLAITYYEGGTSIHSASPIQVVAGDEINNVNITLIERSTHKISGTLTMRGSGRPVTRAMISLETKDESSDSTGFPETQTASPDAQGQWSFDDIVDGIYTMTVAPSRDHEGYTVGSEDSRVPSDGVPQAFIVKRQDVVIGGTDVTGLAIEVSTGGRVSGTVTVEGGHPLPPNITVYPETANGDRRIQLTSPAQVKPDGTFAVDGMPSDGVWLRALSGRDGKYYTKTATANGVDLMREPLMVNEGGEVKGVRIVISSEVATLTGRILVREGGAPLRGAGILLIPAEPDKQRIRSARLYGLTNAEGGFTITGAPGEYMALVLRPGSEWYTLGDENIKALAAASAQRVTLQPNERKKMDIIAAVNK